MTARPEIVLVAALARNGVIGANGGLPWQLPDDLRRFKALTLGKPIVMGRKTWASIGRPLPKRRNVVLSRTSGALQGVELVRSVDDALTLLEGEPEIAIIGGAEIYAAFLPFATRLELTHVEADVEGDTRFPAVDPEHWRVIGDEQHPADAAHAYAMRFTSYVRR